MISNLVSKDFENYLLNKCNAEKIEEIDLSCIEEISLNAINEKGNLCDYDFKDFQKLNRLKYVSLQNFIINNYETNIINRCKSIEGLQMTNCIIKSKSRLQNNIKVISFENCKMFRMYYISLLKRIQVLKLYSLKSVNLKDIAYLKQIEKICFENEKIVNLRKLLLLKYLTKIKMVNCKYNKIAELKLEKYIEIEK